jgi:hypothetical protein
MIKVNLIRLLVLFFLLPVCSVAQNFGGNAPSVKWWQINTPQGKIAGYSHSILNWRAAKKMECGAAKPNNGTQCLCTHGTQIK